MSKIKKEIVKDIIGYEGIYKISSLGFVIKYKSKKRLTNGKYKDIPEFQLKIGDRVDYPAVSLSKNGKQQTMSMHRLMAIHFIENDNPLIKNEINHKNKDIFDYSIENLEWCTRSENMLHANNKEKSKNPYMKKLIELPDEGTDELKALKRLAVDAGMSFKKWIEHVILFQLK